MKALFFKCILAIGLASGIANYVIYLNTGKLPLDPRNFSLPSFTAPRLSLPDVNLPTLKGKEQASQNKTTRAYKWIDGQGVVHYSTTPPDDITNVKTIEVDPNTNMIMSTPIPIDEPVKDKDNAQPTAPIKPQQLPKLDGEMQGVLDEAKQARDQLNERMQKQKKILDKL